MIQTKGTLNLNNTTLESESIVAISSEGILNINSGVTIEGSTGIISKGELNLGDSSLNKPSKNSPIVKGKTGYGVIINQGTFSFYSGSVKGISTTAISGIEDEVAFKINNGASLSWKSGYNLTTQFNGQINTTYLLCEETEAIYAKVYNNGLLTLSSTNDTLEDQGGLCKNLGDVSSSTFAPWVDKSNINNKNITRIKILDEIYPTNTNFWFFRNDTRYQALNSVTEIEGLENLNTVNVTAMRSMFGGLKVESLDLSHFDTRNVEDMLGMFANCDRLREVNLSGFNTKKVTNMTRMFGTCSVIEELDLSSFETDSLTDMHEMFHYCTNLKKVDLSRCNFSNVEQMQYAFHLCSSLKEVTFGSNFVTRADNQMNYLFADCGSLESLNLRGFTVESTTIANYMFYECTSLKRIYYDPTIWKVTDTTYTNLNTSNFIWWFKDVPSDFEFIPIT